MSSAVSETLTYEASVIGPDDGDPRNAASVRDGLQDLANRTKFLKETGPSLTGTNKYALASRQITRYLPFSFIAKPAEWLASAGSGDDSAATLVNTAVRLYIPLDVPNGSTLDEVSVEVSGAGGHAGLPGTMPAIIVQQHSLGANAAVGTSQSDTSGGTGAYQTPHYITKTGLAHSVNRVTNRYFVQLTSESGANALAGLSVFGVLVKFTVTSMDDGAA